MKTILVSGSSSGIGFAICEESKNQGHNVIGISRNINSRATELGIRSYSVDVTNQNQINELAYILKNSVAADDFVSEQFDLEKIETNAFDNMETIQILKAKVKFILKVILKGNFGW